MRDIGRTAYIGATRMRCIGRADRPIKIVGNNISLIQRWKCCSWVFHESFISSASPTLSLMCSTQPFAEVKTCWFRQ